MRIMIKYVVAAALCIGAGDAWAQSDNTNAPSGELKLALTMGAGPSSAPSNILKVSTDSCDITCPDTGAHCSQTCTDQRASCQCPQGQAICGCH
jgi:hypothetical protein